MSKGAAKAGNSARRPGVASGVLLSGAVALLALPSAVLAFSSSFAPRVDKAVDSETIQVARLSAHVASALPAQSLGKGQMIHFTPAGTGSRPDRSVTVAVRVDPIVVQGLGHVTHTAVAATAPGAAPVQIAPMVFNLGVARGYRGFAQGIVPLGDLHKTDTPEIAQIGLAPTGIDDPSRFNPRIVLDERQATGRAPRTFSGSADQVDVGGSYRLGRNLDVTAGLRYSQERERLRPLTDGKQDSQAVYVGTQFRF